ncbi:ArnT family glycosyltransferase [Tahibacter amnicola]|uniref:Glycosyltransferase family 39 protein n=1 Tax=Tahibacter amnicola TaxID=2976241 RepID=A0ABY6BIZ1_9GAMM|nr:glycosyltransferase family 39 protein [Tahibacter amnicola]UXI67812.1 glycosyltransferase family 39 protein [Tahibacter amnicola]
MSTTVRSAVSWSLTPRQEVWLFFAIAFVILFAGLGLRDPWPADEPRFALVAKQMVESGNWLIPHRGSELYSDKPPLFMALQSFFYTLTGQWRVAFLLPSLLAGLGMLGLTYDLGRRLWNHRVGLYAASALLCTFQFVYQAKRAQIDPTVSFFITAANYGLLRHFLLGPDWRAYWFGCFAAGLGVITKGVGVLALLMFAPYLLALWQEWNGVARNPGGNWRWLAGGLFFMAATALWLAPMLYAVKTQTAPEYAAYMNDILFRQTAGRYTESWDHHQPPWYYLGVVLFAWLPLSLTYPWAIPRWWRALKARDARILLPLVWVCLVVLFFTFPKGKRDVYIMPALPLLALLVGSQIESIVQSLNFRRLVAGFVGALGLLFTVVGALAWGGHLERANRMVEQRGLEAGGAVLWGFVVVVGVICVVAALAGRTRRPLQALAASLAALWLGWSFWAYPVLNDSTSAVGVMRRAGEMIGPDAELALVAWKEQNLLHADRPTRDFGFVRPWHSQLQDAARWLQENPQKRWVFILRGAFGECVDPAKATYVGHANRREWYLIRSDALREGCDPAKAIAGEDDDNPNT